MARWFATFGVRRLDAALVSGGLTPIGVLENYNHQQGEPWWDRYLISTHESGVKPPRTKAASSRRTP